MNVLKIAPETGIKFMTYEKSKDIMRLNSNRTELSITEKFTAGAIAGGLSQSAIYPLEMCIRDRFSVAGISNVYRMYRKGPRTPPCGLSLIHISIFKL